MHILFLYDALSPDARKDELDVLHQIEAIERALAALGHTFESIPCDLDLQRLAAVLKDKKPDRVFNLVEALTGKGRLIHLIPFLLDSLSIPYTGASAESTFLTTHKLQAKQRMLAAGLPTPPFWTLRDLARPSVVIPKDRYILKAVWEHASIGIDEKALPWVETADELRQALAFQTERLGDTAFAERYIEGREFNLALLGGKDGPWTLAPAEMIFRDYGVDKLKVVDYRAKWEEDSFEYQNTIRSYDFPPEDAPLLAWMRSLALASWEAFELRGYARVDFRVDLAGQPWILEVNTNPCLSSDAGFAAALQHSGLSYQDAIAAILEDV